MRVCVIIVIIIELVSVVVTLVIVVQVASDSMRRIDVGCEQKNSFFDLSLALVYLCFI